MEKRATEVKTPEFRVSYPAVFRPKHNDLSGKDEFEVTALFPKDSTDMEPFKAAIKAAIADKFGTKVPKNLRTPLKDGDEMPNPQYENHWVMTFKAGVNYPPVVVGTRKGPDGKFEKLLNEKEFYGGCYARAVVNAYAYDTQANKGVNFGLGNLQKLRDGERFGGGFSVAESDFEDTPETEEVDELDGF